MKRDDDHGIRSVIVISHVYLAIFIVALISVLVFKFCNSHLGHAEIARSISVTSTVHYEAAGFDNVLNEKRENLSYIFSVLIGSGAIFFSLFFSNKYLVSNRNKVSQKWLNRALSFLITSSLLVLICLDPIFERYLILFPPNVAPHTTAPILLLAILMANLVMIYEVFGNLFWRQKVKLIFIIVAITLSLLMASYEVFDERSLFLEGYANNFSPVTYPIIQQYLGKALLIDFKSNYGLHPYFTQLVLYIFPATVLTLSLTIASLFAISLLSLAFVIFSIIENKFLALIGFVALIFMQNFAVDGRFLEEAVAFQYEPIRLLFPTLLLSFLYFFCKDLKENNRAKKYYAGLFFFSLATIWNLDSGIPTFVTLVLVLGHEKLKIDFKLKSAIEHLIKSGAILASVWLVFILFLRVKYGQWPVLPWLAYGQSAALDFAYSMLPIGNAGPWCAVVLIYAIGLVLSINNFLTKNHSLQNSFVLASTLLGIGLLTYFIGRSVTSNLMHCGYPAMILLTIFADKFCRNFTKKNLTDGFKGSRFEVLLLSLPLLFISYISSVFFFEIFTNKSVKEKFIFEKFSHESKPYWIQESEFVRQQIGASESFVREDVLLLTFNDQDFYFDLALRTKSPLNVANIRHMFYQKEINSVFDLIKSAEKKWVILVRPISKEREAPFFSDEEEKRLQESLDSDYQINSQLKVSKDGGVTIFERRENGQEK